MKLTLNKTKTRIQFDFGYDLNLIHTMQSLPGSKWEHKLKVWSIPLISIELLPDFLKQKVTSEMILALSKYQRYNAYIGNNSVIHGIITNKEIGIDVEKARLYDKFCITEDWDKFRNPSAKRTKDLLIKLDSLDLFVGIQIDRLFKNGMAKHAFTALKAIGHPLGYDRGWYENRYCDPQQTQFQRRNVDGFSRKEELLNHLKKVVTDYSILE